MPRIVCEIIDLYVYRMRSGRPEFLVLHRTGGELSGTWQAVHGKIEQGETAWRANPKGSVRRVNAFAGSSVLSFLSFFRHHGALQHRIVQMRKEPQALRIIQQWFGMKPSHVAGLSRARGKTGKLRLDRSGAARQALWA